MSDKRIEAVARDMGAYSSGDAVSEVFMGYAREALAAADAADREQGVHRVKGDDEAVERVARAIFDRSVGFGLDWETILAEYRDFYRTTARTVIAALTGSEPKEGR